MSQNYEQPSQQNPLYSLNKNTANFNCTTQCLCNYIGTQNNRSTWDQMQYNQFVKKIPDSIKIVNNNALNTWKK